MEENTDTDDDNEEIDVELWLTSLLAMTSDQEKKQNLVEKVAKNTGVTPEHVEISLNALIKILMEKSRSN